jgi:hypothetical protein
VLTTGFSAHSSNAFKACGRFSGRRFSSLWCCWPCDLLRGHRCKALAQFGGCRIRPQSCASRTLAALSPARALTVRTREPPLACRPARAARRSYSAATEIAWAMINRRVEVSRPNHYRGASKYPAPTDPHVTWAGARRHDRRAVVQPQANIAEASHCGGPLPVGHGNRRCGYLNYLPQWPVCTGNRCCRPSRCGPRTRYQ